MIEKNILNKLNKISKQFLCSFPLISFDWQNIFDEFLSEDLQEYILNKTVNSELVLKYPIHIGYQKLFLKYILNKLEKLLQSKSDADDLGKESVIHDGFYSAYGRLVATGDGSLENYKHYSLCNENKVITLKESNSLISDGTTGLRTWQASLVLSEWITSNANGFFDQTVLELGSGIGLTGLVLKNVCSIKNMYFTDCHETVLNTLCDNIKRNITLTNDSPKQANRANWKELQNRCVYSHSGSSTVSVLNLPWENVTTDICKEFGVIHKVIAADIVYDNDLFASLVGAMRCLKENCNVEEFIFACTERNPETLEEFLKLMRMTFQGIEELSVPPQYNFLWPIDTPVRIFRFKELKQLIK